MTTITQGTRCLLDRHKDKMEERAAAEPSRARGSNSMREAGGLDSASPGAAMAKSPSPNFDCDSEELEMLEDAAQAEIESESELDKVLDEAATIFPPERVDALTEQLKREGLVSFVRNNVVGQSRRHINALLVAFDVMLPRSIRESDEVALDVLVSILKTALIRLLRMRSKLPQYNTVDDAVDLLRTSRRVVVLGGAGISTSCGIPDFRSPDGIYAQLQRTNKYPELTDPTDMFHKDFFLHDPSCFFSFAKDIFPSNFTPSPSHRFIKLLEDRDQLLRHYTQNIDTLEDAAGISRVLHCHGSFSRARCTLPSCGYEVQGSEIKDDIMAQRVPPCPKCREREDDKRRAMLQKSRKKKGRYADDEDEDDNDDQDVLPGLSVMKPCITFFGEKLSSDFDRALLTDREEVDLLIIMGTTLKVAPVSEIVAHFPHTTPIILINRTPVLHFDLDIQLLGDADGIVEYLCRRLGWQLPMPDPKESVVGEQSAAANASGNSVEAQNKQYKENDVASTTAEPLRLAESHFWRFPGAEVPERLTNALNGIESDDEQENSSADASDEAAILPNEPTKIQEDDIASRAAKRAANLIGESDADLDNGIDGGDSRKKSRVERQAQVGL